MYGIKEIREIVLFLVIRVFYDVICYDVFYMNCFDSCYILLLYVDGSV